jgi:signal transduction histidine kinase
MMKTDLLYEKTGIVVTADQLRAIASAVITATEGDDTQQVLKRIAEATADLVNAKYCALGVPDGKGGMLHFEISGLTENEFSQIPHPPKGHGLLGAIMRERDTIRLDHMAYDHRSIGFPVNHPLMDSFLGTPIQVGDQLFGMLYLSDRWDGQPFDEQDEWLVEVMASYAALVIAGATFGKQKQRLSVLEERERISMELHDGVIQSLYALGMQVDLMRLTGQTNEESLSQIINGLNTTIDDIRRYIMNLRQEGNARSCYDQLHEIIARLFIPPTMAVEIDAPRTAPRFTAATFEAICQMTNEAASNAIRHASATHLHIQAYYSDNRFYIVIADNGQGFDPEAIIKQEGLGLRNIHQRAKLHHGEVVIESAPGQGTRLTISVPVQTT